ncbi:MAG: hypothetical protein JWQ87_5466 [Candidatus Sulfotelmatobacter sp.]|nr:hypothetical protein [Candidatus Sulfotelmatobacter sp.]
MRTARRPLLDNFVNQERPCTLRSPIIIVPRMTRAFLVQRVVCSFSIIVQWSNVKRVIGKNFKYAPLHIVNGTKPFTGTLASEAGIPYCACPGISSQNSVAPVCDVTAHGRSQVSKPNALASRQKR